MLTCARAHRIFDPFPTMVKLPLSFSLQKALCIAPVEANVRRESWGGQHVEEQKGILDFSNALVHWRIR